MDVHVQSGSETWLANVCAVWLVTVRSPAPFFLLPSFACCVTDRSAVARPCLARRLPTILPPFSFEEALEVTKAHSITGLLPPRTSLLTQRPFRSPHHTFSDAGLIGGGSILKRGEISLAHHGVLFLDELPEFKREVLEVMRQPLEDGSVTISRATPSLNYPARCTLVTTMNACPCSRQLR